MPSVAQRLLRASPSDAQRRGLAGVIDLRKLRPLSRHINAPEPTTLIWLNRQHITIDVRHRRIRVPLRCPPLHSIRHQVPFARRRRHSHARPNTTVYTKPHALRQPRIPNPYKTRRPPHATRPRPRAPPPPPQTHHTPTRTHQTHHPTPAPHEPAPARTPHHTPTTHTTTHPNNNTHHTTPTPTPPPHPTPQTPSQPTTTLPHREPTVKPW
jgi:hypothetical protein